METLPTHYLDCHVVYFDMVYKYLKSYFRVLNVGSHFLWSHNLHSSQEIILFLTGLAHTEHGYFTGPGCKFMSPDNIKRYLKYE